MDNSSERGKRRWTCLQESVSQAVNSRELSEGREVLVGAPVPDRQGPESESSEIKARSQEPMGKAIRDPELEVLCSLSLFPSRLSGGSLLESIEVYH